MFSRSYLLGIGGAVVLLGGLSLYNKYDLSAHYIPVKARVDKVKKDCYISGYKKKIVDRKTKKIAYMDCDLAPLVARMYHMSESNINIRYRIEYSYRHPKNGKWYKGKYTIKQIYSAKKKKRNDPWRKGRIFKVYAHKTEFGRSRVVKGDMHFAKRSL